MKIRIFILLLIFGLNACAGLGGGATGPAGEENGNGELGSPGSGGGNLLPQSSIDPPGLTKGHVVAYAPDANQDTPVIGDAGSVDTTGMSDADSDGYADMFSVEVATDASEATPVTCPLKMDGSFECNVPNTTVASTLTVAVTDGSQKSEAITETPNPALLYTRSVPKDMAYLTSDPIGNNYLAGVTDNGGIKITETDGNFAVMNSFDDYYSDASLDVPIGTEGLAVDTTGKLAALQPDEGLELFDILNFRQDIPDFLRTGSVTVPDTFKYTQLKLAGDNNLRFVRWTSDAIRYDEHIHNVLDINFNIPIKSAGDSYNASKVITFDSFQFAGDYYGLAIFEDYGSETPFWNPDVPDIVAANDPSNDKTKIVLTSKRTNPAFVKKVFELPGKPSNYSIQDFILYRNNTAPSNPLPSKNNYYGAGLLLDKQSHSVYLVGFNVIERYGSVVELLAPAAIDLGTNKKPIKAVLNTTKTKVFILTADDSIMLMDLQPTGAISYSTMKNSLKTFDLSTLITDKTVEIKADNLAHYQNTTTGKEYLIVTAKGLKGSMVVDVEKVLAQAQ
ncbi:hypothetical protein K1X76_12360 [bacterium]|nr:hypothetical protein [bacterium]